jgi:hypothetical protein
MGFYARGNPSVVFCSQSCRDAWEAQNGAMSKSSESSSGSGSSDNGSSSSTGGTASSIMGGLSSLMAQGNESTKIHIKEQETTKREGLSAINAINFDGDAASIFDSLTGLWTIIQAHKSTFGKDGNKAVKAAAIGKFELGIQRLRSKGDSANADYMEKKLKTMKKKATLKVVFIVTGIIVFLAGVVLWALFEEGYF